MSSSSSSDSDDDLFQHKNAKSVLDVCWSDISKKSTNKESKVKGPKKKKNLLDLVEDEEENKEIKEKKKMDDDDLDVDLILAKNELYQKKARRHTSSSSEGKKKRKQDDEETIRKQLLEQQKFEQERKRKKTQKQMEAIHKDQDVIDLDSETVEELSPISLSPQITSPLLTKKPMANFPTKPTVIKPSKAIDFKIQHMANDAFQKLEAAESFTFDDFEENDVQEELSEAERKRIEAQVQREIEQINKRKELGSVISTDDVEEVDDEDKGEKITIQVRWNEKTISVNIHERDKFQKLKKTVGKKFQVHPDQISFKFDGATLDLNSTPEDQAMESDDIIDCIVDLTKKVSTASYTPIEKEPNVNKGEKIVLEVRGNGKNISINFYKGEKFAKLAKGVAKQFSVAPEKIKLMFDGLALDLDETPADQDMENEDIIDCKFL